ncbi:hypothetical protein BV375_34685 [Nostoc sp. 106C]|nr:hypothetical protein BV375_34685 [Nostoc sp. 106C]
MSIVLKASALLFTCPLLPIWQNSAWRAKWGLDCALEWGKQVLTSCVLRLARCILEVVNLVQNINLNVVVTIFKHKSSN